MAHHKRIKRRGASSCGLCKPHKKPGCRKKGHNKSAKEIRAKDPTKEESQENRRVNPQINGFTEDDIIEKNLDVSDIGDK